MANRIPSEYEAELRSRVREQIALEVEGDVRALYEFTLPAIRTRRIADRDDEPTSSLSQIRDFVGLVDSAEVESVEVVEYASEVERFRGCPAAVVVSEVRYNDSDSATRFRTIWVRDEGKWFSTALGKMPLRTLEGMP